MPNPMSPGDPSRGDPPAGGVMEAPAAIEGGPLPKIPLERREKPVEHPLPTPAPHADAGYIQLRLRVDDQRLQVTDARRLPGQLVQPDQLFPGSNYEALLGGQRLSVGAVPDLSERRSFPDPQGPPERRVHHIAQNPIQEIVVRVPDAGITYADLASLEVTLYEAHEVPQTGLALEGLVRVKDLGEKVRPIARLSSGWLDELPAERREGLRRALPGAMK